MSYFSNKKFSFWIVVAVIIINFTAIGTILYKMYFHHERHGCEREMPCAQSFLEKELHLSPIQAEEFKKLKEKHHTSVYVLFQQMNEKKNFISTNMVQANPDTSMLFRNADEIGTLYAQSRKLYIMHYFELSKLCNAEQKVKLSDIFARMFCCDGSMFDLMPPPRGEHHEMHESCGPNKARY